MYQPRWLLALVVLTMVTGCGDPKTGGNNGANNGGDNNSTNSTTTSSNGAGGDAGADLGTSDAARSDMSEPDMGGVDLGRDAAADMGPPTDPLDGIGEVTLVQEGFEFLEGPHWFAEDGVLRFTDIPADTIYELEPPDQITEWRTPSNNANGLAADPQGRLLAAEHGGRQISITRNGEAQTLVAQYEGGQFNSPNDLVMHSGGWLYFTDPPYGLANRTREIDFNGLFRFVPGDETLVAEWEGDLDSRPNGVVVSPDDETLYMADTAASKVYAFDIAADGALSGRRDFVEASGPDGMAIDADGNLYVTSADGVEVFAPDGAKWGTIGVPRRPSNCAFGGPESKVLFITAREGLYRVSTIVAGIE